MSDDMQQPNNLQNDLQKTENAQEAPVAEFDEETYKAVVGLVQRLSMQLDELKTKQKEYRERVQNIMDNDSQLSAYEEQAKNAADSFKRRKKELLESAEAKEAQGKIREVREEMKDIQESLTNNLLSYFQMTGVQTFDTPDGQEREFKLNARLMPSK